MTGLDALARALSPVSGSESKAFGIDSSARGAVSGSPSVPPPQLPASDRTFPVLLEALPALLTVRSKLTDMNPLFNDVSKLCTLIGDVVALDDISLSVCVCRLGSGCLPKVPSADSATLPCCFFRVLPQAHCGGETVGVILLASPCNCGVLDGQQAHNDQRKLLFEEFTVIALNFIDQVSPLHALPQTELLAVGARLQNQGSHHRP